MKPYIQMNNPNDFALHVPMDLIVTEDDFVHNFRVTFTAANLDTLFEEAEFDLHVAVSDEEIKIDSLGVYNLNIYEKPPYFMTHSMPEGNRFHRTIKLWVVKKDH